MAMMKTIETMPGEYVDVLTSVLEGDRVAPRGIPTREVLGAHIILTSPQYSWASGTGRNLNFGIAAAEGLQLVAGESAPELLRFVSRGAFDPYRDGEVHHGAYGPRLRPQLERVVTRLRDDPYTRQAVVTIWDPLHDMQDRKDLPCTVSMQFLIRKGKLIMVTFMRSNDVYRGFPYDVFQFTLLQHTIAAALGMEVGEYHHMVGSLHAYESDLVGIEQVTSRELDPLEPEYLGLPIRLVGVPLMKFRQLREAAARQLALPHEDFTADSMELLKW